MADPLGLNYSGREGQGIAQILKGDKAGEEARRGYRADTERTYREVLTKQKERRDAMDTSSIDLRGFQKDINGELQQAKNEIRAQGRDIFKTEGVNDVSLSKLKDMKEALRQRVSLSQAQQLVVKQAKAKLDTQRADKYFDIEASKKKIQEYMDLDIAGRSEYTDDLLIRKVEVDGKDAYDLPKALYSPNYNMRKNQFREHVAEYIANTDEGRDWYVRGMNSGAFANLSQAQNFVQRQNELKYKVPTGSTTMKINPYGDMNVPEVAKTRVRRDDSDKAIIDNFDVGNVQMMRGGITDILPKKNEGYGKVEFFDLQGNSYNEEVPNFSAQQYFYDYTTKSHYLLGVRSYGETKDPEDFTDDEVMSEYVSNKRAPILRKHYDPVTESFDEDAVKQELREVMSKEYGEKKKSQTIMIKLNQQTLAQQQGMRPNLWGAHMGALNESLSPKEEINRFVQSFEDVEEVEDTGKTKSKIIPYDKTGLSD